MVGLIVLIALFLYIGLAWFCVYKIKSRQGKIIVAAIFILIPMADIIVGEMYFRYLCNKHSGTFIYKQVGIGDEYYLEPGGENASRWVFKLDFLEKENGQKINSEKFRENYIFKREKSEVYFKPLHINKHKRSIINKSSNEKLSEIIKFSYNGGWIENIYKIGSSGKGCPKSLSLTKLSEKTFYIETNRASQK